MEVYPFHHNNQIFKVFTDYDLTFVELRGVLDELMEIEAFSSDSDGETEWTPYQVLFEDFVYEIWVLYPSVIIHARNTATRQG
ncbi:MAG: hypothetical protein JRG73_11800 [Deltaproteobacteria bacterium]|nr:hypothetical protein [Deltaproteobacteria bacterium]MBW2307605.1 hypothetical protein [Deltaproteobacteria bacterium]